MAFNRIKIECMFNELKEVKYFKEITDLKSNFKEIKRSKSLPKAEAYLEPKRASTMELFCEYI